MRTAQVQKKAYGVRVNIIVIIMLQRYGGGWVSGPPLSTKATERGGNSRISLPGLGHPHE